MNHIMPDPTKIGGYNKIEVPPISINPGKVNAINVAEKVIRMAVNVAPNRIFISQKRIRQLANNLIEKGIICHEPACLVLKIKNGSIQFNLTYWIYNGYRGDMRPLTDIQLLDRILVNIEREENEIIREKEANKIAREEATPEESKEIIQKLLMEFRPENIELSTSFSSSFSFSSSHFDKLSASVVWKKEFFENYNKGRKIHSIGKEIILIYFPLGWKSETK